jgi:transcriptional regulator of met regulon
MTTKDKSSKQSNKRRAELFSQVCDVIERNFHGWPIHADKDEVLHTSKEARAATVRIFEILGVE